MESDRELDSLRVRTAEAWACALNEARISYVIVNGLYGYPNGVGRDLDVLIRRKDSLAAIAIAEKVRERFGWDSMLLRWSPFDTWQLFFLEKNDDRLSWLEIDLMHEKTMLMGAAPLIAAFDEMVCSPGFRCGSFSVSKIGYYIKSQLRPICYGDVRRFEEKYALQHADDPDIQTYLRRSLGDRCAEEFIAATYQGVDAVRGLGKKLKWAINRRFALHRPLTWFSNVFWTRVVRPWNLYWKSSGLVFAIVWPDEEGNVRALDEAEAYFNGCFDTRRRTFSGKVSPGEHAAGEGKAPGLLKRWWNACAWLVRLTVTYYGRDRFLPRSVIQFTIYDGSPGDILRHPQRYGMSGGCEIRLLRRLAPWPVEIRAWRSEECVAPCTDQAPGNCEAEKGSPPSPGQLTFLTGKEIALAMVAAMENIYATTNSI